jgi:hypothetical protein
MKAKIIFVYPAWKKYSNKYYIHFYRNRISYYEGLHPLRKLNLPDSDQIESKVLMNKRFELKKLSKLDRIAYENTNATHEIISDSLQITINGCRPYCIKLNIFQSFFLNWHHKKYIIQALDFKKNIIAGIFGAILGAMIALFIQYISST